MCCLFFFFNDTATTEIYTYRHTLSLHDALPIYLLAAECSPLSSISVRDHVCPLAHSDAHRAEQSLKHGAGFGQRLAKAVHLAVQSGGGRNDGDCIRSEEHTSELQSLMRISYAVFCLKKKITQQQHNRPDIHLKHA